MFDRRQLVARGAAIVLMFTSFGYAQADDANEYLAAVRADLEMADGVDFLTTNRTDIRATADVGGDQPDVIEEIVVIGKEKWQLPPLPAGSAAAGQRLRGHHGGRPPGTSMGPQPALLSHR